MNRIRKSLIVGLLLGVLSAYAASVNTGKQRLRELAVMPAVNVTTSYKTKGSRAELLEDYLVPREIERLRKEVNEHPDDPERLLELGALVDRAGETTNGTAYYEQAEKAARKKSLIRPQDGLPLTCLGTALDKLGKDAEAESVFRKATLVSSNEWRCWVGLGNFLGVHALSTLVPTKRADLADDAFVSIVTSVGTYQAPFEQLERARKMRKESAECFDRAVSLAPKEADAFLGRANVQIAFSISEFLERDYRDRQPLDAGQLFQIMHPISSIADFREAARLCPDDYRVVGMVACYEGLLKTWPKQEIRNPGEKPSMNILPNDTQASLREAIGRLEKLSQSANKDCASGALEWLGFIKTVIFDFTGAKEALNRAVALEPARYEAWEVLLLAAESSDAPPEQLVSICQSLVKCKNSARNHLLLAKALVKQNKPDDADIQLEQAHELQPDSVIPCLISAAVDIQLSADERRLSAALDQMTRAGKLLGKGPNSEKTDGLARAYLLDWAILSALFDKPDNARNFVSHVLDRYPDDQTAKDIMSAIE